MKPFGGLRQEPIAPLERFDQRGFVRARFDDQLNPRPDAVDIGGLAVSDQTQGQIMIRPRVIVFQETNAWCRPVRDPKIQVSIEIPVEGRHGTV